MKGNNVQNLQPSKSVLSDSRRVGCDRHSTRQSSSGDHEGDGHLTTHGSDGFSAGGGAPSDLVTYRSTSTYSIRQSSRKLVRVCRNLDQTVTVCIPTYNRAHWVLEAIGSICTQTYTDWEILLYDDGSTDNTSELVTDYLRRMPESLRRKITYIDGGQNRGVGYARNWFKHSVDTEWSCWQDSDDHSHPTRLCRQMEAARYYDLDCVFTWLKFFVDRVRNGKVLQIDISRYSRDIRSLTANISSPTGLMNRKARGWIPEVVINHGGYDTVWIAGMVCAGCKLGCIEEPLYFLRNHRGRIVERKRKAKYTRVRAEERLLIWDQLHDLGMTNLSERPILDLV